MFDSGQTPPGERLLAWFDTTRRDLPWRRTRDPYAIWVSEVMLQQTTVAAVRPFWERFMAAFPDLATLAAAPLEDVLRAWSGLGYYGRARNLQHAARQLVQAGADTLPRTVADLRALPGVGPYTAAAVASLAYDVPEPVVDGNVQRVISRLFAIAGDPRRAPAKRSIEERARALLVASRPGDSNQSVMELGALICTPRDPACGECPLAAQCRARAEGDPRRFPELPPRLAAIPVLRAAVALVRGDGRLLLVQVPGGKPNAGLWELPAVRLPARSSGTRAAASAARRLRAERRLAVVPGAALGTVRHTITHHRIETVLFAARLAAPAPRGTRWRKVDQAGGEALTGEARKLLALFRKATS